MPDPRLAKIPCERCGRPISGRNMPRHLSRCDGEYLATAEERMWANIRVSNGCWEWTGTLNAEGYGTFYRDGKNLKAHRVVYEHHLGEVPQERVLDHTCHNEAAARGECDGGEQCPHRRCVNPTHLEVVTDAQNIERGRLGYASRSLCRSGRHDITDPSSWRVGPHGRQCAACYDNAQKRRTQRRSELRAKRRAVEQGDET